MNEIRKIVSEKNCKLLISNYSVKEVCGSLNFSEAMYVVEHLFYDDIRDDKNQEFALRLAFETRNYFKEDWEKDWKNDVFLGGLCEISCLYDECYFCYKKIYDKLSNPPAEILLLLSGCNNAPGTPPITNEESEFYLRKALETNLTYEVAVAMKTFYKFKKDKSKEDKAQEEYWDQVSKRLKKENIHSDQIIPDVLNY